MLEFIFHCLYGVVINPLQEVKHTTLGALGSGDAEPLWCEPLCTVWDIFFVPLHQKAVYIL